MHAQAEEETTFTGDFASERFVSVEPTAANTDVVADRNRKTIDDILLCRVAPFGNLGHKRKQSLPEGIRQGVQPTVEPTFAEHPGNIAVFFEEPTAQLLVA